MTKYEPLGRAGAARAGRVLRDALRQQGRADRDEIPGLPDLQHQIIAEG